MTGRFSPVKTKKGENSRKGASKGNMCSALFSLRKRLYLYLYAATLPCVKFSPSIPAVWKFGRCLLASSHAGTRLPIAVIQNSGRSPSVRFSFPKDKKTKTPDLNASVKSSLMTSSGGIIRIRLKGRRYVLPLSLSAQAPLFFCLSIILPAVQNCNSVINF